MKINRRLMELVSIPVTKPTSLYQCGTWSTVYAPTKYQKSREDKPGQAVQSKTNLKINKGEQA